jgi:RES domain-containing protein
MRIWRVCPARRTATAFDGEGARLNGGRWNHVGLSAVYVSATISLGLLEYLVNADPDLAPEALVRIPVDCPDEIQVDDITVAGLPREWRSYPAPDSVKDIGSEWLRGCRNLILSVPSVIVPQERNFVLNPCHLRFKELGIGPAEPFSLDPRLWSSLPGPKAAR